MQYPEMPTVQKMDVNDIDMHDFAVNMLYSCENVAQVEDYIKNKKVVNHYLTIHDHFSDKSGGVIVVEGGKNGNLISNIKNNYLVMSNFSNNLLKNADYTEINEIGSDRYAKAYEFIGKNILTFDVDSAFQCLEKTVQEFGNYPTQSSMVFLPYRNEIYIALRRDFSKVWKVSIDKGTIETFKGFETTFKRNLNKNGVFMNDLLKLTTDDQKNLENHFPFVYVLIIIGISVGLIITIITYVYKRNFAS